MHIPAGKVCRILLLCPFCILAIGIQEVFGQEQDWSSDESAERLNATESARVHTGPKQQPSKELFEFSNGYYQAFTPS